MSSKDPIAVACATTVSSFQNRTHDIQVPSKPYYLFYQTGCANDDDERGTVTYAVEFATADIAEWYEYSEYEAWESYVEGLISAEGWMVNNGTEPDGGSFTRPTNTPVILRVEKYGDNNDDDQDSPGDLKYTVLVKMLKVDR